MLGRLRQAASDVCGGAPRPLELQRAADYRVCMHETLDGAVSRAGAPLVADLYRADERTTLVSSGEER